MESYFFSVQTQMTIGYGFLSFFSFVFVSFVCLFVCLFVYSFFFSNFDEL